MYCLACKVDGEGDIWACNAQILEGTNDALIVRWFPNGRGGDTVGQWGRQRFTIIHMSLFQ